MIPSLPIVSIVFRAFGEVFGNFGALLRAWLIPMLLMIVIDVLQGAAQPSVLANVFFWFLEAPVYALAAVACHRIVLLGPESLTNPWSLHWSPRESSFFVWLLIFAVMMYFSALLLSAVVAMAPQTVFGYKAEWLDEALMVVALFYVYGRFAMVFPATAVDKRMIMSQSWLLTAGNGVRVAIALLLPIAPVYLVAQMLAWALPAGAMEYSRAIYAPLEFVGIAAIVATLSLSYQFLRDET